MCVLFFIRKKHLGTAIGLVLSIDQLECASRGKNIIDDDDLLGQEEKHVFVQVFQLVTLNGCHVNEFNRFFYL